MLGVIARGTGYGGIGSSQLTATSIRQLAAYAPRAAILITFFTKVDAWPYFHINGPVL